MKTRAEKTEELALLKETFAENPVLVLCTFQGLNVDADAELRGEIRKSGGGYRVINNRLARVAAEGESYQSAFTGLKGMTSLAGLVEGQQYGADDLVRLSKMPSKLEVQAKLLYLLNAPAQQLMGVLKASARDIASVIQQGVEKEKFAG